MTLFLVVVNNKETDTSQEQQSSGVYSKGHNQNAIEVQVLITFHAFSEAH